MGPCTVRNSIQKFNGSHFVLPPASIYKMTGLAKWCERWRTGLINCHNNNKMKERSSGRSQEKQPEIVHSPCSAVPAALARILPSCRYDSSWSCKVRCRWCPHSTSACSAGRFQVANIANKTTKPSANRKTDRIEKTKKEKKPLNGNVARIGLGFSFSFDQLFSAPNWKVSLFVQLFL